jgi:glycosyltransferase involved in cell wall biosynthesis
MHPTSPLVSICIPTYQAASWIAETLASALAQDHLLLEVVISDDASTDGTLDIVESIKDERLRVLPPGPSAGMAANWNRSIRAARGEYVKLLMQDDLLEPDCVSAMAAVLDRHPAVGFVFSPRTVLLDDPTDPKAQRWRDRFANLHDRLEPLGERNEGRLLFEAMKRDRFRLNCFGEPTAVMVRRAAFERVGLFAERMPQLLDEEMWLRLAYFFDVGFVPRPLVTIRVHDASATSRNNRAGSAWLDPLWMLEGLREHPEIRGDLSGTTEIRLVLGTLKREARRALVTRSRGFRRYARDVGEYLRFRRTRPRPTLHESLPPVGTAAP